MALAVLFPETSTFGRNSTVDPHTLGAEFYVTAAGVSVTKLRQLIPTNYDNVAPLTMAVFDSAGTRVTPVVSMPAAVNGEWCEAVVSPEPVLTKNERYRVACFWPLGGYPARQADFSGSGVYASTETIGGFLVRPNNADSAAGQGLFNAGPALVAPNSTYNSSNYFADVEVRGGEGPVIPFVSYPTATTQLVGWRYLAAKLNGDGTETPLAVSLPLSGVSITDPVSTAAEISFTITPEVMRLKGPDGRPILRGRSTIIYAELDGVIRAGGIVHKTPAQGPALNVTCRGLVSVIDGQPWTNRTIRSVGADPADILRILWSYWQSHARANVGLQLPAGFKTSARVGTIEEPIVLSHYENVDMGQLFHDMCEVGSIDYRERHAWEPDGTISHHLELGSPRLGRRRTDIQFMIGLNVAEVPGVEFDSDEYASEVLVLGAGEGDKMTRGWASNPDGDRIRSVKVIPSKGIGLVATANLFAAKWVKNYASDEMDVESLVVVDHPLAPLFSWDPGDEVFLSGDSQWGGQLGMWVRILATTVTPDSSHTAELKVARADKAV